MRVCFGEGVHAWSHVPGPFRKGYVRWGGYTRVGIQLGQVYQRVGILEGVGMSVSGYTRVGMGMHTP